MTLKRLWVDAPRLDVDDEKQLPRFWTGGAAIPRCIQKQTEATIKNVKSET